MFYALALAQCLLTSSAQINGAATMEGAKVQLQDRQELPNARHTSDVMDATLISPIGGQIGGGGIDFFDPVRMSVHGRSITQLRFFWGGVDITDPARGGQPLVDMPVGAWNQLVLHTLWRDRPGVTFITTANSNQDFVQGANHASVLVQGSIAQGDVGHGLWWPNSWFDRNNAQDFGAPQQRRALTRGKEGELHIHVPLKHGALFVLGERVEHRHRYLTTSEPEGLTRDTALLVFNHNDGPWASSVRAMVQLRSRDQEGAAWRFDDSRVQQSRGQAWLLQAETSGAVGPSAQLHLALGAGGRTDDAQGFLGYPGVGASEDLSDTWLLLSRPKRPEKLQRWLVSGEARLTFVPDDRPLWQPDDQQQAGLDPALHLVGQATVARWRRQTVDGTPYVGERMGSQGITMQVPEGSQDGAIVRHELRAGLESHWPLGGPGRALEVSGGIDMSGVTDEHRLLTQAVGPSAGAMVTWRAVSGLDTFIMLRREPEAITAQVADFLGAIGPRGGVFDWQDNNGDAVPDADEMGARLGGFGGPSHQPDQALRRPGHTQLALGVQTPKLLGLRFGLRGVGHALSGRYTVAKQNNDNTTAVPFHDPGGDGRGEGRAPGGGQDLTVYAEPRVPSGFVLRNDTTLSYYLGLEAEIRAEPHPAWYLSVLGATYLANSHAPFGNFADRNDPGVIDEASATLNNRLHSFGRTDSDHAFALKILAAVRPIEGLSLGLAARYRDGEPFTRIVVDAHLPQGPTALMATPRGKARHTALMLWDVRLRYTTARLRPLGVTLVCDVYNLLNATTEIAEDPRTGPTFRRALEAIPGRSMWAGLAVAFLP